MEKIESCKNLLCTACLCVNRKLKNITDAKVKQYYMDTLKEIPLYHEAMIDPLICWECHALLKRAITFKEQVKDCYRILQTYTNENLSECLFTDVSRPPRLTIRSYTPINVQTDGQTEALFNCVKEEDAMGLRLERVNVKNEESNRFDELKAEYENGDADNLYLSDYSDDLTKLESEERAIIGRRTEGNRKRKRLKSGKEKVKKSRKAKGQQTDSKYSMHTNAPTTRQTKRSCTSRNAGSVVAEVKEESKRQLEVVNVEFEYNSKEYSEAAIKDEHPNLDAQNILSDCSDTEIKNGDCAVSGKERDRRKKKTKDSGIKKRGKIVKELRKKKQMAVAARVRTVELSHEEMLLERERDARRPRYLAAPHRCQLCLLGFSYERSYREHVAGRHAPELGEYSCPVCKTVIASVESFTAHYKRHMRRYECGVCGKRTMDRKVMNQHYDTAHDGNSKQYKCNLCGKLSNTIDAHRYHRDTHKKRAECKDCDKTFSHRAGLMNHKLTVHKSNGGFPCSACDKVFRWKTSLKKHMEKHDKKSTIRDDQPYCEPCGVSFSSVCSYQRHMKNSLKHVTEDELKYVCADCNKKFANKTKLRDHIEEKHLMKTYQCSICFKPSKNRVCLDQHIRNVHRGRPKNKICHHCGKGFPTKVQLESHIRSHTGEKPFICEYCPTTFSQQSNLYKHNRQVHMNIKAKRYPMCRKRKDKPTEMLQSEPPMYMARPIPTLHFAHERDYRI